jgi:hypothetical protein
MARRKVVLMTTPRDDSRRPTATFPVSAAPALVPPDRALTDGSNGSLIPVLCFGSARIQIKLRFDEANAQTIAKLSRAYRRYRRVIVPTASGAFVAACLGNMIVIAVTRSLHEAILASYAIYAALGIDIMTLLFGEIFILRHIRAIPQYPVLNSKQIILKRLHPDAAIQWAESNLNIIRLVS